MRWPDPWAGYALLYAIERSLWLAGAYLGALLTAGVTYVLVGGVT